MMCWMATINRAASTKRRFDFQDDIKSSRWILGQIPLNLRRIPVRVFVEKIVKVEDDEDHVTRRRGATECFQLNLRLSENAS
jgi:hypothetical protein